MVQSPRIFRVDARFVGQEAGQGSRKGIGISPRELHGDVSGAQKETWRTLEEAVSVVISSVFDELSLILSSSTPK